MNKTKLFIDFDGCLCNTAATKKPMFEAFEKAGFSKEEIVAAYQAESLDYKFDPAGLAERLLKTRLFNLDLALARVNKIIESMDKYLFSDTIKFLESVDRSKYELHLLSLGNQDFQKQKIAAAKIEHFFDFIHITEIQKWEYLKGVVAPDEKFILIDDREDTVANISKQFPHAFAIAMKRKESDKDDAALRVHVNDVLKVTNFDQAVYYLQ